MHTTERNSFADEAVYPCDFSSILDCAESFAPSFTGTEPPHNMYAGESTQGKTFLETYLEDNPDVRFTPESVMRGIGKMMEDQGFDLNVLRTELEQRWTAPVEEPTTLPDPVGDLILHFNIFYEHVHLLEGYPKEAQPQLHELRLLGTRVYECLLNRDGTLHNENVKRVEEANMHVTLDGGFIQVVRGKAVLRQKA